MLRFLSILLVFSTCDSLGILELQLKSTDVRRMYVCIGPDCLLGRRYIYLNAEETTTVRFNITGGQWQKDFTISFQLTKSDDEKESRYTETWSGNVSSGKEWQTIQTSPVLASMRYICSENIYGSQCNIFCLASEGLTGHFSCGSEGERICSHGWTGLHCTKPDCPSGCGNGTCVSPGICRCQFGFKGNSCQECMPHHSCIHGTCANNVPGTCSCKTNWTGQFCDQTKDYCSVFSPCQNGGTCTNGKLSSSVVYTCDCPNGYGGRNCEKNKLDHICGERVCHNGGKCHLEGNSATCTCPKGFSGTHCEVSSKPASCSINTCRNGGTCVIRGGIPECVCPTCFTGSRCELAACVGNATVTLSSSSLESKTGETLVLGLCFILALIGTVLASYYVFYRKLKEMLLVNSIMSETRGRSEERIAKYTVCSRSSFEAPPPYVLSVEDELQPKACFSSTKLYREPPTFAKLSRIADNKISV